MKCFSAIVYYLLFERKKEQNREKFENEPCTCENKSIPLLHGFAPFYSMTSPKRNNNR